MAHNIATERVRMATLKVSSECEAVVTTHPSETSDILLRCRSDYRNEFSVRLSYEEALELRESLRQSLEIAELRMAFQRHKISADCEQKEDGKIAVKLRSWQRQDAELLCSMWKGSKIEFYVS
jgi:hypothetical protein